MENPSPGILREATWEASQDMLSHHRARLQAQDPRTRSENPRPEQVLHSAHNFISVITHLGFSKIILPFCCFVPTVRLVWLQLQIQSYLLLSIRSSLSASCSRQFLSFYHQFLAVLGLPRPERSPTNIPLRHQWHLMRNTQTPPPRPEKGIVLLWVLGILIFLLPPSLLSSLPPSRSS